MKGMSEYDVYFASCTKGILQIVAYSVYIDSCMKVCVLVALCKLHAQNYKKCMKWNKWIVLLVCVFVWKNLHLILLLWFEVSLNQAPLELV